MTPPCLGRKTKHAHEKVEVQSCEMHLHTNNKMQKEKIAGDKNELGGPRG